MNDTGSRFNLSNFIAASMVALGLVVAALIMTHRPLATATDVPLAKSVAAPPITQNSVAQQFRTQMLRAPGGHQVLSNKFPFDLADVEVSRVLYSLKADTFSISFRGQWSPIAYTTQPSPHLAGSATFTNDGYGHYFGDVTFNDGSTFTITLK